MICLDTLKSSANGCKDIEVLLDLPNDQYHARQPWISRSTAFRYRGLAGGVHQRFEEVRGKRIFSGNAATGFGTLVDTAFEAVARGVDWRSQVAVPPAGVLAADGSRRGKAFTEWRQSLPAGSVECNAADFAKVADIIEAIREHKIARELLESITHSQYSVFLTDAAGHQRKARADGVTAREWFDLKTTSSEWPDLRYSFARFGYHWQAAWYSHAAAACGWEPFTFRFVVVQANPPHEVRVVSLSPASLARAEAEIAETLDKIRERRESGEYVPEAYHEEFVLDLF
jgi:hypothetical protein